MNALREIANLRLHNQLLGDRKAKNIKEIIGWFGAMQAQDFAMAKWAIGVRLPGTNDCTIENLFNQGEIIRTHVMRPTWHFTLAEDIRWMLALTAPHIRSILRSYNAKLQLDQNLFKRTNAIIENLLRGNNFLTRSQIVAELKKKKIELDNLQGAHVMFDAELNGLVCNGPMLGRQFTYALMDERIPATKSLARDEALTKLALKYFTSHGPATVQDFTWWSGLPAADARVGLEMVKGKFLNEKIESKVYWFAPSNKKTSVQTSPLFLPAYDEFMLGYTDRSASLEAKFSKQTLVGNGIFRPIIVVDGKIVGIWLRTVKKNKVMIAPHFFKSKEKLKKKEMELLLNPFGQFLNLEVALK